MRAQGLKLTNVYSMSGYTNEVMVPLDSPLKSIGDLRGNLPRPRSYDSPRLFELSVEVTRLVTAA